MDEALKKASYILATYDSNGKESLKLQYKFQIPKAIKDLFPDFKTSDTCVQEYVNNSLEVLHKNIIYQNYNPVDQASLEICTVFYQGFFGMWSCATSEESIANSGKIEQCLAGATHEAIAMIDVVALVNGVATLAKEGTKTYLESYVKYYENLQSIDNSIRQRNEVQTAQILGVVLFPPYNIATEVIEKVVKVADNFKKSYFKECDKTQLKNGKIADICWYRYGQLGVMIVPIVYTGGEYAVTKVKQIADISKTSITLAENVIKLNEKLIAKGVYLLEADGKTLIKNATTSDIVTVESTVVKDVEKALDELGIVNTAGSDLLALLTKQKQRLLDLKAQYGNLDFIDFFPVGGKTTNDITSSMYNEMFADLGSRTNWTIQNKTDKIVELLGSGKTVPQKVTYQQGAELFKVVKKGGVPSPTTEYWVTKTELDDLMTTGTNIESKSGLPLGSIADEYDIYKITANQPASTYRSTIAPTKQRGYTTTGGATQTLVLDRSVWSSIPVKYNTQSFIPNF